MLTKALIDTKSSQTETEVYPVALSDQTVLLSTRCKNDVNNFKWRISMSNLRVSLPDSEYLQQIGEIAYTTSSLEWTLLGDIFRLKEYLSSNFSLENLEGLTTGQIARKAMEEAEKIDEDQIALYLSTVGKALKEAAEIRNDTLHSRPATDTEGKQRLQRSEIGSDHKPTDERFWIDDNWLEQKKGVLNKAFDAVNQVRPSFKDYPS